MKKSQKNNSKFMKKIKMIKNKKKLKKNNKLYNKKIKD